MMKKEEECCKLEYEVTNLKRKIDKSEASFKFMNSSTIIDDILNN